MTEEEYWAEIEESMLALVRDGRFWNIEHAVARVTTFLGAYRPDVEETTGRLLESGRIFIRDGYYVVRT